MGGWLVCAEVTVSSDEDGVSISVVGDRLSVVGAIDGLSVVGLGDGLLEIASSCDGVFWASVWLEMFCGFEDVLEVCVDVWVDVRIVFEVVAGVFC